MNSNNLYDLLLSYLKKFFFPEDWLDLDLNFSKVEVLTLLLVDRRGEVSMSRICEEMNMPMSTATGIVDRMVKKELLQRERSESDRRLVLISLSEKGKEVINHWKEVISDYVRLIEDALTDEEQQLLYKVFLKIVEILNQKRKSPEVQESGPVVKKIDIE